MTPPHPPRPPKSVALPSGRVVAFEVVHAPAAPLARAPGASLFSELWELVSSGDLRVVERGETLDIGALSLGDFHALRAIATHLGWLAEEPVEITCRNCDAAMTVSPCAALALGPFVDRELYDPELDATLAFGAARPIPPIRLLDGTTAGEVTFEARTLAAAVPLHRALRRREYTLTGAVVRGMGLVRLGTETDPARIARALSRASDVAWGEVARLFLDGHYPPRLFALVLCAGCGARNDVDAPFDREFDRAPPLEEGALSQEPPGSNEEELPSFDVFSARAEEIWHETVGDDAAIVMVVDDGVPACDDGGEPLLGSYVPGFEGGASAPSRPPEVTVYYRTFRAIADDEGPFDWAGELRETIEHELEHHRAGLTGEDPMDDEERAEIRREATRVLGEKALARKAVSSLGVDVAQFFRRTWPVWLIVVVLTWLSTLGGR